LLFYLFLSCGFHLPQLLLLLLLLALLLPLLLLPGTW
jgi:hypothetical protein